MAETAAIVSNVSFVIAAICLILAVFFWFQYDILSVIGDLSGRNARKSIAQMRACNETERLDHTPCSTGKRAGGKTWIILDEVILIHTNEEI